MRCPFCTCTQEQPPAGLMAQQPCMRTAVQCLVCFVSVHIWVTTGLLQDFFHYTRSGATPNSAFCLQLQPNHTVLTPPPNHTVVTPHPDSPCPAATACFHQISSHLCMTRAAPDRQHHAATAAALAPADPAARHTSLGLAAACISAPAECAEAATGCRPDARPRRVRLAAAAAAAAAVAPGCCYCSSWSHPEPVC
jgi:hypothetical protein